MRVHSTSARCPTTLALVLLGTMGSCEPFHGDAYTDVEAWSEESRPDHPLNVELLPATVLAVEPPGSIGSDSDAWIYTLGPGHPADPGRPPVWLKILAPKSYHADLEPEDRVWLTVEQDPFYWSPSTLVEVRSVEGDLLFYYHSGTPRWTRAYLESYRTETWQCGLTGNPRVTYLIDGPGLDPAVEVTLRQGQIKEVDTVAGRYAVLLGAAQVMLSSSLCVDVSGDGYEQVTILRISPP